MVSFVIGPKGSGKTKWLIDQANVEIKKGNGNIIFIDVDDNHIFSLDYSVRLINAMEFNINSIDVSMYEKAMDPDDVETAHSRLCDILINMNPEIAFSSYATYLNRITGYEKVFHIDYKNGKKSGFDVEADGSPCCPDCDEPLIDITEYEPSQTYQCECGYEYDPVEEFDWFVESYDSLAVDDISELKK